jgi:hypothetical protein
MKKLTLLGSLILAGCATAPKAEHFTPPSALPVIHSVQRLRPIVDKTPEGRAAIADLDATLTKYQDQVEAQSKELIKAQEDAVYWHDKQIKALRELWLWRSIALASVLAVVGYIGLKTSWRFFL